MDKPKLINNKIDTIYHNKYLKLYSMSYDNGAFYLQASRREVEDLVLAEPDDSKLVADAVTCILVVKTPDAEPRLYMEHEYRYPVGRFILSPPAGLIDKKDRELYKACLVAAAREIKEETGIEVKADDKLELISPLFFSSPGMTDESNAMVLAEVNLPDLSSLTNDNAEGTECFDGYSLLTKAEVLKLLKDGKDEEGHFFSIFTWGILLYFALNY